MLLAYENDVDQTPLKIFNASDINFLVMLS